MNISFVAPMRSAWDRMVRVLFRPFSLQKWFVLGFAAFLSEGLARGGGFQSSMRNRARGAPDFSGALHRMIDFLRHPVWGVVALVVLTLACIAFVLLLWVRSRGHFIFLDDVVHERAAIVEPWRRFARRGNALFLFSLVTLLLWGGLFFAILVPALPAWLAAASDGRWRDLLFLALGEWVALAPLALAMAYFYLFLSSFVIPLMYRDDIGPLAAWGRFLGLFVRRPVHFLAYGLMVLVLSLVVFAGVMAVGLGTCCIGFFLIGAPYIGSVVTLPVEVVFRGLGIDFLAQFGPEYSVFTPPAPGSSS